MNNPISTKSSFSNIPSPNSSKDLPPSLPVSETKIAVAEETLPSSLREKEEQLRKSTDFFSKFSSNVAEGNAGILAHTVQFNIKSAADIRETASQELLKVRMNQLKLVNPTKKALLESWEQANTPEEKERIEDNNPDIDWSKLKNLTLPSEAEPFIQAAEKFRTTNLNHLSRVAFSQKGVAPLPVKDPSQAAATHTTTEKILQVAPGITDLFNNNLEKIEQVVFRVVELVEWKDKMEAAHLQAINEGKATLAGKFQQSIATIDQALHAYQEYAATLNSPNPQIRSTALQQRLQGLMLQAKALKEIYSSLGMKADKGNNLSLAGGMMELALEPDRGGGQIAKGIREELSKGNHADPKVLEFYEKALILRLQAAQVMANGDKSGGIKIANDSRPFTKAASDLQEQQRNIEGER